MEEIRSIEYVDLENKINLLIKYNLTSKELKETKEVEITMLETELKEIDKKIKDLKDEIEVNSNDYTWTKENELYNKLIALNVIPAVSIAGLLFITGNANIITDMGAYSIFLTGVPTLVASSIVYVSNLKKIRKQNKEEYTTTDEYQYTQSELETLEIERKRKQEKIEVLRQEINVLQVDIHNKGNQIVYMKNRLAELRRNNGEYYQERPIEKKLK